MIKPLERYPGAWRDKAACPRFPGGEVAEPSVKGVKTGLSDPASSVLWLLPPSFNSLPFLSVPPFFSLSLSPLPWPISLSSFAPSFSSFCFSPIALPGPSPLSCYYESEIWCYYKEKKEVLDSQSWKNFSWSPGFKAGWWGFYSTKSLLLTCKYGLRKAPSFAICHLCGSCFGSPTQNCAIRGDYALSWPPIQSLCTCGTFVTCPARIIST